MRAVAAARVRPSHRGCVTGTDDLPSELLELLREQDGIADTASVLRCLSRSELRWRLSSGRWQRICRGVVAAYSGPLTDKQRLWAAVLWAGPGAVLAGLTAAALDGLAGFTDRPVHLLVPASRSVRRASPAIPAIVHYSRFLGENDVHPMRRPPRTRVARSLVDAAAWMATDRGAQAVLAAGVQQRLARAADLAAVVTQNQRLARRAVISATLADIAGGAHALSELDFTRLLRQYRLPEPDRQAARRDPSGRRRWLDAVWESARLMAEIDGSHHMDASQYWADMGRDNDFTLDGYRVLRFPAFAVRHNPAYVAGQIRDALRGDALARATGARATGARDARAPDALRTTCENGPVQSGPMEILASA
jgi:very-short-patch-repair endonuclease